MYTLYLNYCIYSSYLAGEYGLWHTICVDGRKEFNLLQYGQELFAAMRNDTSRVALRRGKSTDVREYCIIYLKLCYLLLKYSKCNSILSYAVTRKL